MYPEIYRQAYTALYRSLEHLHVACHDPHLSNSSIPAAFQTVQQAFQAILALDLDELKPQQAANAQSYYTEINKQLRLLSMDVMFLQTSRQSSTSAQRQQQMGDRLKRLQVYCEALLGQGATEEAGKQEE